MVFLIFELVLCLHIPSLYAFFHHSKFSSIFSWSICAALVYMISTKHGPSQSFYFFDTQEILCLFLLF